MSALWWLCDLISLMFNSCMWNVFWLSDIQRKLSLQIFFMHFANLWFLSCFALGDVWLKSCFSSLYSHHCLGFFCFSSQPLSWGWIAFGQTTHLPLHFWFQGGIWTGYDCLSFIPLLPDGNQLITHSCHFLDMEQTKFNFVSYAVGGNVHCCILIKAADFSLLQRLKEITVFSIWKKVNHQTCSRLW